MVNPITSFFQQTALFLLKLLRHLIIQTLILAFVFLDVHIHRQFIVRTIEAEKTASTVKKSTSPPNRYQRQAKKQSSKISRLRKIDLQTRMQADIK